MTQHARLASELVDDQQTFLVERFARRGREGNAAIGFEEVLDEEVHLPHQLVAIERDSVGDELVRLQLGASALHPEHELDCLRVERVVFGGLREMRLERHIAEVFQNEDAEVVGMAGDRRNRQRDAREQPAHVDKRELVEDEGCVIDGEHDRRVVGAQKAKVLTRRRVAGERNNPHVRLRQTGAV